MHVLERATPAAYRAVLACVTYEHAHGHALPRRFVQTLCPSGPSLSSVLQSTTLQVPVVVRGDARRAETTATAADWDNGVRFDVEVRVSGDAEAPRVTLRVLARGWDVNSYYAAVDYAVVRPAGRLDAPDDDLVWDVAGTDDEGAPLHVHVPLAPEDQYPHTVVLDAVVFEEGFITPEDTDARGCVAIRIRIHESFGTRSYHTPPSNSLVTLR